MTTFRTMAEAFIGAKNPDKATLGRIDFWVSKLGARSIADITSTDIDAALVALEKRGKLKAGRGYTGKATGEPLAGATVNRYIAQAGSIFLYARRKRVLPRGFVPPTYGIEREPEPQDPERYLRPEEVARLLKVAPAIDLRWRKMQALIVVAYHTGLRVGSIMRARGKDMDLKAGTLSIPKLLKNGDAFVAALSTAAVDALRKLPRVQPDELVFSNRCGRKFNHRKLFAAVAKEADLEGATFHWLRHGHGFALAKAGTSQQMIMHSMAHRSLKAAARYSHANVSDKRQVIQNVFG